MFTLDGDPTIKNYRCGHCGRQQQSATGFVLQDGTAFAAYHAYLHDDDMEPDAIRAAFTILFADWAHSGKQLKDGVAFGMACRIGADDYEFMLQLPEVTEQGVTALTREQALKHPRMQDAWDVIDYLIVADPHVHATLYGHEPTF